MLCWGEALLAADVERVGAVEALGLDETLFGRQGRWRTRRWCTSIVDVCVGQLLEIVHSPRIRCSYVCQAVSWSRCCW